MECTPAPEVVSLSIRRDEVMEEHDDEDSDKDSDPHTDSHTNIAADFYCSDPDSFETAESMRGVFTDPSILSAPLSTVSEEAALSDPLGSETQPHHFSSSSTSAAASCFSARFAPGRLGDLARQLDEERYERKAEVELLQRELVVQQALISQVAEQLLTGPVQVSLQTLRDDLENLKKTAETQAQALWQQRAAFVSLAQRFDELRIPPPGEAENADCNKEVPVGTSASSATVPETAPSTTKESVSANLDILMEVKTLSQEVGLVANHLRTFEERHIQMQSTMNACLKLGEDCSKRITSLEEERFQHGPTSNAATPMQPGTANSNKSEGSPLQHQRQKKDLLFSGEHLLPNASAREKQQQQLQQLQHEERHQEQQQQQELLQQPQEHRDQQEQQQQSHQTELQFVDVPTPFPIDGAGLDMGADAVNIEEGGR
mmetsp:Transcript_31879/g.67783  ORF Transcript_31879/g.67783 Transcript_31879/m.67783 type:complete len:431 (-) Transcript_31879:163-1455(-)